MVLTTAPEQVDHMTASYARIPLAVRIPGRLVDQLPQRVTELLASTEWTFLVGGWSEPVLAMLPESSRHAQLERELVIFRAAGIDRVAGFVAEGWDPALGLAVRRARESTRSSSPGATILPSSPS